MPLYDASRKPEVAPEDAVLVVHDFVGKCRAWAVGEIAKREATAAGDPVATAKLEAWRSYLAFTDHTLRELEEGTLDRWFKR
jgi:hypothetical protein